MMNKQQLKGNWNVVKGKLKQKFPQLQDDDLRYVEGQEEELMGRMQKRLGKSREDLERAIDQCCAESAGAQPAFRQ